MCESKLQFNEQIIYINGYEKLYSITSFGRVWSHEKISKYNGRIYKAKFLKPGCTEGYLRVGLCKNNKVKTHLIHRLVAQHYIRNPLNLPEVNHKDGNKSNCKKDNLEWSTSQDNHKHALVNGLKYKKYSKYYGVSYNKGLYHKNKPWGASVRINGYQKYLGYFETEIEAAFTYNYYIIYNNLNKLLNNIN